MPDSSDGNLQRRGIAQKFPGKPERRRRWQKQRGIFFQRDACFRIRSVFPEVHPEGLFSEFKAVDVKSGVIRIFFVSNLFASGPVVKKPAACAGLAFPVDGGNKVRVFQQILRLAGKCQYESCKWKKIPQCHDMFSPFCSFVFLHRGRIDEKSRQRHISPIVCLCHVEVVTPENIRVVDAVSLSVFAMSVQQDKIQSAGMSSDRP